MTDDDSSGKRCAFMTVGLIVMIGGFFGGFMQFFWMDTHDVGTILFYVMVVPMISFLVGSAILVYGMKDTMSSNRMGLFGSIAVRTSESRERTYVHEPPSFCKDCGKIIPETNITCIMCGAIQVKLPDE